MQNVHAASTEAEKTYGIYSNGMLDSKFSFIIPVFENMPIETEKPNQNKKVEASRAEGTNTLEAKYYSIKERTELLNNINGEIITTLDKGAKVSTLNSDNDEWTEVMLFNGIKGYIKANVIDTTSTANIEFAEVIKEQELYQEPTKAKLNEVKVGETLILLEKNTQTDEQGKVWDKVQTIEGVVAYCPDDSLRKLEK